MFVAKWPRPRRRDRFPALGVFLKFLLFRQILAVSAPARSAFDKPPFGTFPSIWYATGGTPDEEEGTVLRKLGTLRRSVKSAVPSETAIKS